MKRYEYRAWHTLYGELCDVKHIDSENHWAELISFDEVERKSGSFKVSLNDIILMRCTGLKDSFNKEVYEDDILMLTHAWTGDERLGVIEWDWDRDAPCIASDRFSSLQLYYEDDDYIKRVAGNIHENNNLLEEE